MMSSKQVIAAAAAVVAMTLCAPAAARAAVTAAVAGDDGTPIPLAAGAPPVTIHNMDTKVLVHVDPADATSYQLTITDAASVGAGGVDFCWDSQYAPDDSDIVNYHGNGTYTLTLQLYSAEGCKTLKSTYTYTYAVAAAVVIAQPPGPVLLRQRNSSDLITQELPFAGPPGGSYQVNYALGGVLAPDGGISGPVQTAFVDSTTGKVGISASTPGRYLIVGRATADNAFTPWSAPVVMTVVAPFDLSSVTFPDDRGPHYKLRGVVGEPSAGGKVSVAYAKGKNGTHFHGAGSAKVNSKGAFTRTFTIRPKRGTYRLRFKFGGSATVVPGTVYVTIRIRKILV